MIKEEKNIDFYTTGRQPSEQDFARISELIKKEKQKQSVRKQTKHRQDKCTSPNTSIAKSGA
jgi:hypothetical protein